MHMTLHDEHQQIKQRLISLQIHLSLLSFTLHFEVIFAVIYLAFCDVGRALGVVKNETSSIENGKLEDVVYLDFWNAFDKAID